MTEWRDGAATPVGSHAREFEASSSVEDWRYLRRLLITMAAVGLAYFLWRISGVLLLIFAAVLLAVLLRSFADLIARQTPLAESWSLALAVLIVGALVCGFVFLFGAQVGGQLGMVIEKLPLALDTVGERLGLHNFSSELQKGLGADSGNSVLSRAAGIGYTIIGALADLILVVVAAIYLAADPKLYRRGTAKLLPPTQHTRIFDAMDATGNALRLWFSGQLMAMVLVGVASGLAYWWIGLPSPLALATIAAITNFVPYVGPLVGAIPALVFASAMDTQAMLWTIAVTLIIQQLEGNVLTPYIQSRTVSMPAVVVLFSIAVFGFVFGVLGVLLGVPLAVAITVLVKKLWIQEALGETTEIPGEDAT